MAAKFVVLAMLVAAASAGGKSYTYSYGVADPHTGDVKGQHETRIGDSVVGQYSLLESDGTKRTVDYAAGPRTGFKAVVRKDPVLVRTPVVAQPAPVVHKAYASPVAYSAVTYGAGGLGYGTHGLGYKGYGLGLGYGAQGLGYGAQGLGYGAHNLGYSAHGLGYGAQGFDYGAYGLGYSAHGLGYGAQGLGYGTQGLGYGAQGLGYSAHGLGYGAHSLDYAAGW